MADLRRIRVMDDHAEITLSDGSIAIIDKDDSAKVSGANWSGTRCKNGVYAQARINGRPVFLHRLIAGEPKDLEVDHRDRDTLNCRRGNLRVVTHAQNQRNLSKPKNNTSGFKGVSFHRASGRWHARIHFDGREISLGYYPTAAEGGEKYDEASRRLHGEHGAPNSELMRA